MRIIVEEAILLESRGVVKASREVTDPHSRDDYAGSDLWPDPERATILIARHWILAPHSLDLTLPEVRGRGRENFRAYYGSAYLGGVAAQPDEDMGRLPEGFVEVELEHGRICAKCKSLVIRGVRLSLGDGAFCTMCAYRYPEELRRNDLERESGYEARTAANEEQEKLGDLMRQTDLLRSQAGLPSDPSQADAYYDSETNIRAQRENSSGSAGGATQYETEQWGVAQRIAPSALVRFVRRELQVIMNIEQRSIQQGRTVDTSETALTALEIATRAKILEDVRSMAHDTWSIFRQDAIATRLEMQEGRRSAFADPASAHARFRLRAQARLQHRREEDLLRGISIGVANKKFKDRIRAFVHVAEVSRILPVMPRTNGPLGVWKTFTRRQKASPAQKVQRSSLRGSNKAKRLVSLRILLSGDEPDRITEAVTDLLAAESLPQWKKYKRDIPQGTTPRGIKRFTILHEFVENKSRRTRTREEVIAEILVTQGPDSPRDRAMTAGERATAGLSSASTGFPSPTAHPNVAMLGDCRPRRGTVLRLENDSSISACLSVVLSHFEDRRSTVQDSLTADKPVAKLQIIGTEEAARKAMIVANNVAACGYAVISEIVCAEADSDGNPVSPSEGLVCRGSPEAVVDFFTCKLVHMKGYEGVKIGITMTEHPRFRQTNINFLAKMERSMAERPRYRPMFVEQLPEGRAETAGEIASSGKSTSSGAGRGGASGNGTNPPKKAPPPLSPAVIAQRDYVLAVAARMATTVPNIHLDCATTEYLVMAYQRSRAGAAERLEGVDWCCDPATLLDFPGLVVPYTDPTFVPVDRRVFWDNHPVRSPDFPGRVPMHLLHLRDQRVSELMDALPVLRTPEAVVDAARLCGSSSEAYDLVSEYLQQCFCNLDINQAILDEIVARRHLIRIKLVDAVDGHEDLTESLLVHSDRMHHVLDGIRNTHGEVRYAPVTSQQRFYYLKEAHDEVANNRNWYEREVSELSQHLKYTAYQRYIALRVRRREYNRFQEACRAFTYIHYGVGINLGVCIPMISLVPRVLAAPAPAWNLQAVPRTPYPEELTRRLRLGDTGLLGQPALLRTVGTVLTPEVNAHRADGFRRNEAQEIEQARENVRNALGLSLPVGGAANELAARTDEYERDEMLFDTSRDEMFFNDERQPTAGEDAAQGLSRASGSGSQDGGSGNGTNPMNLKDLQGFLGTTNYGRLHGVSRLDLDGPHAVRDPFCYSSLPSPPESLAKSREAFCLLKLFLNRRVPATEDEWRWLEPPRHENGWEWLSRQGMERRITLMGVSGRFAWPQPRSTPNPSLSTTEPLAARTTKAVPLGRFSTRWNLRRRIVKVLAVRKSILKKTLAVVPTSLHTYRCVCTGDLQDPPSVGSCILPRAVDSMYCSMCADNLCGCACGICDPSSDPASTSSSDMEASPGLGAPSTRTLRPRTHGELAEAGLSSCSGSSFPSPTAHVVAGKFLEGNRRARRLLRLGAIYTAPFEDEPPVLVMPVRLRPDQVERLNEALRMRAEETRRKEFARVRGLSLATGELPCGMVRFVSPAPSPPSSPVDLTADEPAEHPELIAHGKVRLRPRVRKAVRLTPRVPTAGEIAEAGLSSASTGFPSPTAHLTPLGAIVSGTLMVFTPLYTYKVGDLGLEALKSALNNAEVLLGGTVRNILALLTEICDQLRLIAKALGKVGVTSGYLIQWGLFLLGTVLALFYAPLAWKLLERGSRNLMIGKGYSSDAVADGPPDATRPSKYYGLPTIRAVELEDTLWSEYVGYRIAFTYLRGTRLGEYREGVLLSFLGSRLLVDEDPDAPAPKSAKRHYFLAYMGDVIVVRRPILARPALLDAEPNVVKPGGPGSDSIAAASASRAESSGVAQVDIHAVSQSPWLDAVARLEVEEKKYSGRIPFYVGLPAERMLYNPDILPFIESAIRSHSQLLRASLYCIDTVIVEALSKRLAGDPTEVYLVLDANQSKNPSCGRQRRAMMELKAWGVHMNVRCPGKGITSAQHEKTWIFDRHLMIIGSANCTYNSFTNCEEADVATQSPVLLASHIDHFAMLWESSIEVDWDELEKQEDAALLKKRLALDDKRARSPSRNR